MQKHLQEAVLEAEAAGACCFCFVWDVPREQLAITDGKQLL